MRVFVDAQVFEVEGDSLTGAQIRELAQKEGKVLVLRGDQQIEIVEDELVALQGDDRFVMVETVVLAVEDEAKRPITIFVDGDPYETDRHELTGEQIKALAKKPPGNRLFRIAEDGQRVPVADDEKVHLHEGEQFVTLPPVGRAS